MKPKAVLIAALIGMFALVSVGADSCGESTSGGGGNNGSSGGGGGNSSSGGGGKQEQAAKPTPDVPETTSGQEQALVSAQNYIDLTGFSKAGLIDQLSSSAGDGFSEADATYAANNVDADWNAEAVEAAQAYLDLGAGMSESGLIDQLSSSAGDKFTAEQAQYAADKVYGG